MSATAPVLVLGAPFSGTSLLAQMLGGHPALTPMPELRLSLAESVGALLEVFDVSQAATADGLLRAVALLECGGQHDSGIAEARRWLTTRSDWSTSALVDHLAKRVAPQRLVIPDCETALRPNELLFWLNTCPDLTVVQAVRHPLIHGAVWVPWLREQLFVPIDYRDNSRTPLAGAIDPQPAWLRANANLQRWIPPAQRLVLRMEALDADPGSALGSLCAALGLPFEPAIGEAMMAMDGPFAGHGPAAAAFGLEAEVLEPVLTNALPWPPSPQLDQPLPWAPRKTLDAAVITLGRTLGYR